jgi:2-(1,2-epoxy-1,2-dihydrophenyl)acetyl-CoA isomerase
MSDEPVLYEVRDAVAHITFNRPEASNSLDLPAALRFSEIVSRLQADGARAVLLTGNGPRFCAGGDVASMLAASDRSTYLADLARSVDETLLALSCTPIPVVAAVHGAVAGAGLAVLLNADVVIAERSTKFVMAYAGVGLTPDCGLSYLLPRAIGQQRALELAVTGRVLTAQEALDWGLIARVVDADDLTQAGADLAAKIAAGPTEAFGQAKRLIRSSWDVTRGENAADEVRTIAAAVESDEASALIAKFVARS